MAVSNNAMLIRRSLIARIAKMLMDDTIIEKIDRIPIEMRPRGGEVSRCCIYKDRAMIKYKIMAILGYGIQDETDELTPLSEYVRMALERTRISRQPLSVVDEACSACVKVNYVVTNMCRGCVARPCMMNCPKDAIRFENGRADITPSKCVNCGLCQKNCPFHAIVYMPVPCEESCPVGAISKDEHGVEHIDDKKCIYCGRCTTACPFGAILEKTHLIDIYKEMKANERKVVAIVAPAIAGQFRAPLPQILGAIKALGFDEVLEVAEGADVTTEREAEEFVEKMAEGQAFMTTSCCPSYMAMVGKHLPEIKPFVSHTGTPMHYSAEIAKERYPGAAIVFVGPCLAKRYEAYYDHNTDYMLSFEEIGSMFVAAGIDVDTSSALPADSSIDWTSRQYAIGGGVANAVKLKLGDRIHIDPVCVDGLTKATIRDLRGYAKSCPGNMVEVMACEGGCVNGCNVIANPKIATRQIKEIKG